MLCEALQPGQYAVVRGSGKYDGTLVQVVSVHGATAIVTLAEEWQVRAESIRRAPKVYHASNEPFRNMTGSEDPHLHASGGYGTVCVHEPVILDSVSFGGDSSRSISMMHGTVTAKDGDFATFG